MKAAQKKLSSTLLRSILIYTAIVLLCFSAVFTAFFFLTQELEEERSITTIARNAAEALDSESEQENIEILRNQFEEGIRYTLIDQQGAVVFDSDGEIAENHSRQTGSNRGARKGLKLYGSLFVHLGPRHRLCGSAFGVRRCFAPFRRAGVVFGDT